MKIASGVPPWNASPEHKCVMASNNVPMDWMNIVVSFDYVVNCR